MPSGTNGREKGLYGESSAVMIATTLPGPGIAGLWKHVPKDVSTVAKKLSNTQKLIDIEFYS